MKIKKWVLLGLFLLILVGITGYFIIQKIDQSVIPRRISKKINFAVFYPAPPSNFIIDSASFTYDDVNKTITFNARSSDTKLIISEQATPSNFTDIPQLYDKTLEQMHSYTNFDSVNGKVSLTRPQNVNNNQVAVLNSRGTLAFFRSDKDLSEDEWRHLFNNLNMGN